MLKSQEMRKLAPEMDPLRIGTGWKKEDLEKPQIMVESTYGDSHPGSGHLNLLVEEVRKGVDFLYIRYKNSIQRSLICRLAAALREKCGLIQQHAVHAALADAPFYGCLKFTQVRILIK